MLARQKMIRCAGLAALLAVFLFAFGAVALAVSDPIDFIIQVTPKALTEPGPVTVSLRAANTSTQAVTANVTLYDPAGNVVTSFGNQGSYSLSAEAFRTWEGTWNVTQAQLDAGKFAYTLKYTLTDENGEAVEFERKAEALIEAAGEKVTLSVTRTITPEIVRSGSQATVTYELYNNGNTELTDIRVKENISKTAQTIKSLPAGQRKELKFSSRMGNADLKSNATITYKAKGSSRNLTQKVDDAVIPLAKPNLKIELSSPTAGVNIGEAATLVITFINKGNVSYSNVKVVDDKKGEILTNISIPAGETVTRQKEYTLKEPTTFKVTASLPDNTGETRTLNAGELTIGVFDPEKSLRLTLNLTCDQETVPTIPADVRFRLTVTNNSNVKAEKIAITHGATQIYTIPSLEAGAHVTLTRDVRISQAGKFRFTASVQDALKNTVTFDSNTLSIAYARPTAAPTAVPVITVAPPELVTAAPAEPALTQARSAVFTAAIAIGALFGVALVLFLVSSVIRIVRKAHSNAAYDHLELGERRDYTEPADEELEDVEIRTESTPDSAEENDEPVQPVVKKTEETPDLEEMPDWDGEGGYRVTRPAAPEPASEKQDGAKPEEASPEEAAQPAEENVPDAAMEETRPALDETVSPFSEDMAKAEKAVAAAEEAAKRRRSRRAQRTEDGE